MYLPGQNLFNKPEKAENRFHAPANSLPACLLHENICISHVSPMDICTYVCMDGCMHVCIREFVRHLIWSIKCQTVETRLSDTSVEKLREASRVASFVQRFRAFALQVDRMGR